MNNEYIKAAKIYWDMDSDDCILNSLIIGSRYSKSYMEYLEQYRPNVLERYQKLLALI